MVDVKIGYNPWVKNIGVTHDLIVGCSVFTDTVPPTFVVDLYWFVIYNMPSGADWSPVFMDYLYTSITGITVGNYLARCRAWKNYDLTGATKIGDIVSDSTVVGAVYMGGALYGDTIDDGIYLDTIDRLFTVEAPVEEISMDITYLEVNVA